MVHKISLLTFAISAILCAADQRVIALAGGYGHSVALRADGTVIAWGANNNNQSTVPSGLTDVALVTAGGYQSLALKKNGTIVQWGDPQYTGTIPAALQGTTRDIVAGGYHAMAQKKDSLLVGWGGICCGLETIPTYKVLRGFSGMHTMAVIKLDSTVVAWGFGGEHDYSGTVPADLRGVVDIAIARNAILAIKKDNSVAVWGNPASMPEVAGLPPGLKVRAAAGGDGFFVALKMDGSVVQWGTEPSGVKMPTNLTNIIAVAAGRYHALAVGANGAVYAWGDNTSGQCNVPSSIVAVRPDKDAPLKQLDSRVLSRGWSAAASFTPTGRLLASRSSDHRTVVAADESSATLRVISVR